MLGLGAYESSSEEEVDVKPSLKSQPTPAPTVQSNMPPQIQPSPAVIESPNGPVLGPASGPAPMSQTHSPEGPSVSGRSSPFSATRALVHDLTLPPVPNLDIPPSPPGSPNAAANAKFEHFLSLKKQGVHFNAKLASSSSLRNPRLLMKMMEHAGIDEKSQYNTSLPSDIWDISNLPQWAFKEELLNSQQEARQKLEEKNAAGQRSSIEFVSGTETKRKANP
ncbi:uncharacterized protein N7458_007744 [Penicillium daleae]|uniref:HCNGP-like protein n=1 Tax=Penicillium daleae TaxID=63821 RepID=A0AAD6C2L1_9EURO|nr:uncharacterized protein N7458_007744 [Penicillium daleae]KAJ5443872.1 hypothetical protein N7458_007744 [Penicillium daleae]